MRSYGVAAFKAHCLSILEEIAATGEGVVVTKRGKPLARVLPSVGVERDPREGLAGSVQIVGDIVSSVVAPQEWDALRDEFPRSKRARPRR